MEQGLLTTTMILSLLSFPLPTSALCTIFGERSLPWAVLNAKKKKKNPVQNGVILKEPADSTCLHPGVPNCSTMSP